MADVLKAKIFSRVFSKVGCKRLLVGLSLGLIASSVVAPPAQAQFPYWYFGIGQSLLYPLTRGLGMPYLGGPYSANPFYATSSYLRRTAGRASQFPYIYPFNPNSFGPYGYRNAGMPPGNATQAQGDGMVDPNTGRSLDPDDPQSQASQSGSTQNGSAPNFYLPGPQTQYQTLYGQPNQGSMPPQFGTVPQAVPGQNLQGQVMPNQAMTTPMQTDANGQPVMLPNPYTMPPKAPKHGRNKSKAAKIDKNENAVSPAVPASSQGYMPSAAGMANAAPIGNAAAPSPLADGFVDHLVTKYDGHMGNALNNSDTRNWAKAMGLIDDQHSLEAMPADRIEVMGRILKDSTLDSVSKVDAMRILLKQKPATK
ncbi:hypothetical protein KA344_14470 [bacterium]|jgi:hypothetical protein|nr:hypothetical protein [bacterium]